MVRVLSIEGLLCYFTYPEFGPCSISVSNFTRSMVKLSSHHVESRNATNGYSSSCWKFVFFFILFLFLVTPYLCGVLALSFNFRHLALTTFVIIVIRCTPWVEPKIIHHKEKHRWTVKGVEPSTRRASAAELVAFGRLLRWGYAPLPQAWD